jgi:DinB superfamily
MDTLTIKKSFQVNSNRIAKACEGITQTEALFRPYDKTNSLLWHVGHLSSVRNTILKLLNPNEKLDVLPQERELFGLGSQIAEASAYPPLETMLAVFQARGARIGELLDSVTDERWAAESQFNIPSLGTTVGQQVYSFMIHEANHYGEINVTKLLIHRLR